MAKIERAAIEQADNAKVVKVGASSEIVVQPSEYEGRKFISVLLRGPSTAGHLASRVQITPEILSAIQSFSGHFAATAEGALEAPKTKQRGAKI